MTFQHRPIDYRSTVPRGNWITQTGALLVDAYRELNAAKLFWITLIISLLVVVAFAFVGINEQGVTVFGKLASAGAWNSTIIPPGDFYKFLFIQLAIPVWLAWLASILALISVGSIFPNLLTGGSIDLYLAKPISRMRFFLTKYFLGLLFVALQVLVFSFASFLVIGFRGGAWEPKLFIAVPMVTLFFSYLFCVCVLLGIITRSTLASILFTLLFWLVVFGFNSADAALLVFSTAADRRVAVQDALIEQNNKLIADDAARPATQQSDLSQFKFQRDKLIEARAGFVSTADQLRFWYRLVSWAKTPLPKTGETVDLIGRWVINPDSITRAQREAEARRAERRAKRGLPARGSVGRDGNAEFDPESQEVAEEIQDRLTARTALSILGTSIAFEAFILGIAGWIFCRRDF